MRFSNVQPAWIVCRKLQQFPISDDLELLSLAERGRIRPDDYLFSPRFEACIQAKQIAEIEEIFYQARLRRLRNISSLLAWGAEAIRSQRWLNSSRS